MLKRTKTSTQYRNGLHVEYSNASTAWIVMWYDQVLSICNERWQAEATCEDWLR